MIRLKADDGFVLILGDTVGINDVLIACWNMGMDVSYEEAPNKKGAEAPQNSYQTGD